MEGNAKFLISLLLLSPIISGLLTSNNLIKITLFRLREKSLEVSEALLWASWFLR